jgi:hypothetical protein
MKINIKLIALSLIIISCLCLINDISSRSLKNKMKKSKALSKSRSRTKAKDDGKPWTREVGMGFIRDLSKLILEIPSNKSDRDLFLQNIYQFCFNAFEEDKENHGNLETAKSLWSNLSSMPLDTVEANFKTTRYQNTLLMRMASIEVMDNNQNSTCMQSLTLKDDKEIDKKKVSLLFKKTFSGYSSPLKNAKKFMNSHYDRYRSQMPDDAFINMNIESGGGVKEKPDVEKSSSSLQGSGSSTTTTTSTSTSTSTSTPS